jgi:hypothetical protein
MRNFFLLLCLLTVALYMAACHTNTNTVVEPQKNAVGKTTTTGSSALNANDLETVQPLLAAAPQLFTVAARTVKKIQGRGGLRVTVDPAKLETADGKPVNGSIQVTVKEMATALDMVAENSPTVSDGRLLESGGSYYVGMTCNGQTVHIKKGMALTMEFPRLTNKKMELFFGDRGSDGAINWKPISKALTAVKELTTDDNALATKATRNSNAIVQDAVYHPYSWYTKSSGANGYNATLGYRASMLWLHAYEDSVMESRRDWIANSCEKLTQEQITGLMETPVRISRREVARLRIPFTKTFFGDGMLTHMTTTVTYQLKPIWYADSMELTKEYIPYKTDASVKWVKPDSNLTVDKMYAQEQASQQVQQVNDEDINDDPQAIVDVSTAHKKRTKITIAGKEIVTVHYYAPVEVSGLGYINCDHFYESPFGTTPLFTLNIQGQVPKTVGVYIIFRNINSMLSEKAFTDSKGAVQIAENLPLNVEVEFLVYSKINDQFVESKQTVKVTANMVLPVAFKPVADSQVKQAFLGS